MPLRGAVAQRCTRKYALMRGRLAVRRAHRRLERLNRLPEVRAFRRHGHTRTSGRGRQLGALQLIEWNVQIDNSP